MKFILDHLLALLGTGTIIATASAWIGKNLAEYAQEVVQTWDTRMINGIKNPAVKEFALDLEAAVLRAVPPNTGAAKYAIITDDILKELPPEAEAARPIIVALFTALGTGARQGIVETLAPGQVPPTTLPPAQYNNHS